MVFRTRAGDSFITEISWSRIGKFQRVEIFMEAPGISLVFYSDFFELMETPGSFKNFDFQVSQFHQIFYLNLKWRRLVFYFWKDWQVPGVSILDRGDRLSQFLLIFGTRCLHYETDKANKKIMSSTRRLHREFATITKDSNSNHYPRSIIQQNPWKFKLIGC